MTEGAAARFDRPQQRPYQEKPLTTAEIHRVEDGIRAFPARIGVAVDQIRRNQGVLGKRFAIGLAHGGPKTASEALVIAGNVLGFAYEDYTFQHAETLRDLRGSPYHPITDINPDEIGRVHELIKEAKAGDNMDLTDTRFIGFIDASQENGWTLGVVDTDEHTVTEFPHESAHGHY